MLMNFKQCDENVNEWLCTLTFVYCLYWFSWCVNDLNVSENESIFSSFVCRSWMHLRAIGRQFTQMNAYFLVMNSKRRKRGHQSGNFQPHMSSFLHFEVYSLNLPFFTIRPCHRHCKLSKNGPFRHVSKSIDVFLKALFVNSDMWMRWLLCVNMHQRE